MEQLSEYLLEYLPVLCGIFAVAVTLLWGRRKKPKTFDILDGMDMGFLEKMSLRLRILETNYGRDDGWYVEDEGRRVALLTEPCFVDMFWESYQITVLSESPRERADMLIFNDFWLERPLVYISRGFGLRAEFAFSYGLTGPGRVCMRGLYLPVRYTILEAPLILASKTLFRETATLN